MQSSASAGRLKAEEGVRLKSQCSARPKPTTSNNKSEHAGSVLSPKQGTASSSTTNASSKVTRTIGHVSLPKAAAKAGTSRNIKAQTATNANKKESSDRKTASPKPSLYSRKQFELNAQRIAVNKININVMTVKKKDTSKIPAQYFKYM